jgi:multidrug efflux pump subunit AcrA (membrane-fusion protein)
MPSFREIITLLIIVLAFSACHETAPQKEKDQATAESGTPVTVAPVEFSDITDSLELNATSAFRLNSYVKAPSTGYIRGVNAVPGEYVQNGKILFTIETKESIVIGKSISSLDTNFKFNGATRIAATGNGYITQLNHQDGDYVQDGELLAVISNVNSFVFLMNLPFAWRSAVKINQDANLYLPDGTLLKGRVENLLPSVDSVSQSQVVVIKVNIDKPLPENLIAKVKLAKMVKKDAQTVPKSAVLSDEAQANFWVMKMIDSTTAAKVDIKKGVEWKDRVEVLDPKFDKNDQIVVTGNYGLPDTARVILSKP